MSLSLKLPRQQRRTWFRQPRALEQRQWVENLPLDRSEAALRLINRRLRSLNFTAMAARQRMRCLAPFPAVLRELHERLTDKLRERNIPLPWELQVAMKQLAEAWARLVAGYLCALRDARGRESKLSSEASLFALRALCRLILARSQVYAPVPVNTWRYVHECYLKAAARSQLPDEIGDAGNADNTYKQALLLGATGLHRLHPVSQLALFHALEQWVAEASIRRLRGAEPKGPPIIFRPGDDEAPRIYSIDSMPEAPGLRMIDPAPLAGRARKHLNRLESEKSAEGIGDDRLNLNPDTLRTLLNVWSVNPVRRFPRAENVEQTRIALGLLPAWHAVSNGPDDGIHPCQLVDRSASGFLALIEKAPPGIVHIGELVAVPENGDWTLGVVRWLQVTDEGTLHLGVEALAREAAATSIRTDGGTKSPAFLLQGNPATDQPPTVITPRAPWRERMTVSTQGGDAITLSRCLESTSTFRRFRYQR